MNERIDWVLMGRAIGTATGWDQADTWEMVLYDFEPAEGVMLPRGEFVNFNFETGLAVVYDANGAILETVDVVTTISDLPQVDL